MPHETIKKKRGTLRQRKVAKALVENLNSDNPLPAGRLLESIGYAKSTATAMPSEVIEAEGVKNELELLGFSEEKAKEVVGQILSSVDEKASDRLKAADMVFDVFGTKAPTKTINVQIDVKNRHQMEQWAAEVISKAKDNEA